jgi:hypothetical protein
VSFVRLDIMNKFMNIIYKNISLLLNIYIYIYMQ